MSDQKPLPSQALYTRCDPGQFAFQTTGELDSIDVVIGQQRALEAVRFGLGMAGEGYNLFALGPSGMGKFTAIRHMVGDAARERPPPADWCYIHNFEQPHQPRALRLPAGRGAELQRRMAQLVEDLSSAIPTAFDSEEQRRRVEELEQQLKDRQTEAMEALSQRAREQQIALLRTPGGFGFAPMDDKGEVLPAERFAELPEKERQRLQSAVEELEQELQKILRQFPQWARDIRDKIRSLGREIAGFTVNHLLEGLRADFHGLPAVLRYLDAVQTDVVDNVNAFLPQQENPLTQLGNDRSQPLQRYRVNLLVDNSKLDAAPVVHEDLPSHVNLLGRVEHQAQMGTLITDFTLIKAGALHRANGGYLLLDAREVLMQPFAWDSLKRALRTREIRMDALERSLSLISTVSLEPEPIPLDLKVVLVGDRWLYYLLCQHDPDFADLFKVMADFDETLDRGPDTDRLYARLFATLARSNELRALDRGAVARLIEHAARLAGDAAKTATDLRSLADLLREADHWAGAAGHDLITAADIQQAIDQQIHRAERLRERIVENIRRGTILIDTDGARSGQINGLSVLQLNGFAFGQPIRITATTRIGEGKIVDIERETEMGGPIHTKGVMILSSFLASRYATREPLSVAASLVFEQSYGMVEGDSASLAELCALLSSLADLPIQQSFAVTGSVNQLGQVQPIGGVNEKIEGFFDVCRACGLRGSEAVIIPSANVKHLMLRHDVVEAVENGQFRVYAVDTVDQAMALLTGVAAGSPDSKAGSDTVNARVVARLERLSQRRRAFIERQREAGHV